MTRRECGAALTLVYTDGVMSAALYQPHDGGEAYMRPLIRRGLAYAKTMYDAGEIAKVLLASPDMTDVGCGLPANGMPGHAAAAHVYYVIARTVPEEARKTYAAKALHRRDGARDSDVPWFADDIPPEAKTIA